MALSWVRLDVNIGSHDKVLRLLSDPAPKAIRYQAAWSYCAAMAWAGGAGTDGHVPTAALPFVHGNKDTARLLVKHRLWRESGSEGYDIVNYCEYQPSQAAADALVHMKTAAARKGNCTRWHGKGCWIEAEKRCGRE